MRRAMPSGPGLRATRRGMDVRLRNGLILLASMVIPGSGHVILGLPKRGLFMLFWMVLLGFLTSRFAGPDVSVVGRYAGGLAVWVLSVVDVHRILKVRRKR